MKRIPRVNELDEHQFQNCVVIVFSLLFTLLILQVLLIVNIQYIYFYPSFICIDLKCVLNIQIDFKTICFNLGLVKNLLILV